MEQIEASWQRFRDHPGEASFAPLFESTKGVVYTICRRILRDPEDTADAFQATYARLLEMIRGGGGIPGGEDPRGLIARLAVREADALRKRRGRRGRRETGVETMPDAPDERESAVSVIARTELREKLERLVDALPEDLRLPVQLYYFHGMTQPEIASALRKPVSTISHRLGQALRRLAPATQAAGLGEVGVVLGGAAVAGGLFAPPAAWSAGAIYAGAAATLAAGAVGGTGAVAAAMAALRLKILGVLGGALLVTVGVVVATLHPSPPETRFRLPDGSFDPVPARADPFPGSDPMAMDDGAWRARYQTWLAATQPTSGSTVAVYPALDRTPRGVHTFYTVGFRPAMVAALSALTNAQTIGAREPEHAGLPSVAEMTQRTDPDDAAWARRALDDAATSGARFVITGFYDAAAATGPATLRVDLIDRLAGADAAPAELWSGRVAQYQNFDQMAQLQRDAMQGVARALIARGRVRPLADARPAGFDLTAELEAIAELLATGDQWAVMDGIDRALALARLDPDDSLPIQAAAYGMEALHWQACVYSNAYGPNDTRLLPRVWALAQLARAMDPGPALPQLVQGYCELRGGLSRDRPDSILRTLVAGPPGPVPLGGLWEATMGYHLLGRNPWFPPADIDARYPLWQKLQAIHEEKRYYGGSSRQADIDAAARLSPERDLRIWALCEASDEVAQDVARPPQNFAINIAPGAPAGGQATAAPPPDWLGAYPAITGRASMVTRVTVASALAAAFASARPADRTRLARQFTQTFGDGKQASHPPLFKGFVSF